METLRCVLFHDITLFSECWCNRLKIMYTFLTQVHPFFTMQKKGFSISYQPRKTICAIHVCSKRLESKAIKKRKKKRSPENEAACLNMKWYCPNITCFLPEYGHLKNPRGDTAPKLPSTPTSVSYAYAY